MSSPEFKNIYEPTRQIHRIINRLDGESVMILNDNQIRELLNQYPPMISPNVEFQVRTSGENRIVSYGLSSFGYDIRIGREFRVFRNRAIVIDPLNFDERVYDTEVAEVGEPLVIPPHSYVLGVSMEQFYMPTNVVGICVGKSTYARCGIIVNVTPLEPGWIGFLTIEVANTTSIPAKIYPGQGIAQILFFRGDQPSVTYADRSGKYQNQDERPIPARS